MENIYLPDYHGGSIVNLMSSIAHAFNAKHPYPELRALSSSEIKKSKNVILLVVDGMGYEQLVSRNLFLKHNIKSKITSVFPSTTAAGITAFMTGVPVQQHGLSAWFVFLKEIGILSKILPFNPRMGGPSFTETGYNMKDFLQAPSLMNSLRAKSYVFWNEEVVNSSYSRASAGKAKRIAYKDLNDFFNKLEKITKKKEKKYIFAYWPFLDAYAHDYGVGSKKYEQHFKKLDKKIKIFLEKIKGTNTQVIITADHGQINGTKNKMIWLKDYSKITECLTLPFAGEGRVPFCYVHPSKASEFENYVKTHLGKYCTLHKSEELIKKNFFGLGPANNKLFDRVGDYILIMKENYILRDWMENKNEQNRGHHGGVSKEEMFVPLIVFRR